MYGKAMFTGALGGAYWAVLFALITFSVLGPGASCRPSPPPEGEPEGIVDEGEAPVEGERPEGAPTEEGEIPRCTEGDCGYQVLRVYPHDRGAFTQGLIYAGGQLYEGTGMRGASSLRQVDLETGQVLRQEDLGRSYFGEGIVLWENRIIQLTWKSELAFVYDRDSFALIDQFTYEGQGWGITHDGEKLIMSNGSATLTFRDPQTFEVIGTLEVKEGAEGIDQLNELEFVRGEVLANVWQTDRIARINPETGAVTGWIDCTGLLDHCEKAAEKQPANVLNGIAYDPEGDRLFLTGKYWPCLFEVRLIPKL